MIGSWLFHVSLMEKWRAGSAQGMTQASGRSDHAQDRWQFELPSDLPLPQGPFRSHPTTPTFKSGVGGWGAGNDIIVFIYTLKTQGLKYLRSTGHLYFLAL